MKKLSAVVAVLMCLIWLPAWGQEERGQILPGANFTRAEICKRTDGLAKDKSQEQLLQVACDGIVWKGKHLYPTEAGIEHALAQPLQAGVTWGIDRQTGHLDRLEPTN